MRNNKILTVAVALALGTGAVLTLDMRDAAAYPPGNLLNFGATASTATTTTGQDNCIAGGATVALSTIVPAANPLPTNTLIVANTGYAGSGPTPNSLIANNCEFVYSKSIFGATDHILPTRASSSETAGVVYTIDGYLAQGNNEVTLRLSDGVKFAETPILVVNSKSSYGQKAVPFSSSACPTKNIPGNTTSNPCGGKGFDFVKFALSTGTGVTLSQGDELYLSYLINNASTVLADGGKHIYMDIAVQEVNNTTLKITDRSPASKVAIATSADEYEITFTPQDVGSACYDVNTPASLFADTGKVTGQNMYVSSNDVQIGFVKCKANTVFDRTGNTPWLGEATLDSTKSVLTITGGQFAASKAAPGKVYLGSAGALGSAATVTDTEATFKLDSTLLGNLCKAATTTTTPVGMVSDGKNILSMVDTPPTASVNVIYSNAGFKTEGLTFPADGQTAEMRIVKPCGAICWVYNVPNPNATDVMSLRITNDATVEADVTAALFPKEGGTGPAVVKPDLVKTVKGAALKPGQTVRLTTEDLVSFFGQEWTERAVVRLTSTVSRIEVLALLRNRTDVESGGLSNISSGAHGTACENVTPASQ